MKTIEGIQKEINSLRIDLKSKLEDGKTGNKEKGQINKLSQIKIYLEHNPSKEYLLKTISRLENKEKLIKESYIENPDWDDYTNDFARKNHYKTHGLPEIRKQLNNLYYILN